MNIRDVRQDQFADTWIERGMWGILNLAPRFGNIRVAMKIMNKFETKDSSHCLPWIIR